MEKQSLKDLFFIGSKEAVEEFLSQIKARCIQVPTDDRYLTINTQYGVEKVVYNSDHDSYFDQHMNEYKVDEFSQTLEPIDSFVKVLIHQNQRKRAEGARYSKKYEMISQAALDSEVYLVNNTLMFSGDEEAWLYRENPHTIKLHLHKGVNKWTDDRLLEQHPDVKVFQSFFDEDGNELSFPREVGYAPEMCTDTVHFKDRRGMEKIVSVISGEIEAHSEFYKECRECGQIWKATDLNSNDTCMNCTQVYIYDYHCWDHDRVFKRTEEDVLDEAMYFGTEVETVGDEYNKWCIQGHQDLWHLEYDGSLSEGGFEMISQPMTWNYVQAHKDEIAAIFQKLQDAGQESENSDCCGLHVHVSRVAFNSDKAVERAIALVHRLDSEFKAYSRRDGEYSYCQFFHLKNNFKWNDVKHIKTDGHNVAINCGNIGEYDKDTVEFRFFKGTLDIDKYMAAIEMVKRIVEVSNSNKLIICMRDLMEGTTYVDAYIKKMFQQGTYFHLDSYVCDFTYAEYSELADQLRYGIKPYSVISEFCQGLAKEYGIDYEIDDAGIKLKNPEPKIADGEFPEGYFDSVEEETRIQEDIAKLIQQEEHQGVA